MSAPDTNVSTDPSEPPNPPPPPKPGRWGKFGFALRAIQVWLRFIGILVVIGLLFGYWNTISNYWDKWTRPAEASAALASDTEFYCPMHPKVVRASLDSDGSIPSCPICNMPLSKRQKGETGKLAPGVLSRVEMSPEQVRMAGVATAKVSYQPLVRSLRTVGYVTHDQEKSSGVVSRTGGYVEKLYVDKIFQMVQKGDRLAEIYSPDLYAAAQYLVALRGNNGSDELDLVASTRERLRLLGVSKTEIDEIWKSGKAKSRIVIRSPQTGYVIQKNVVEGARIEKGETLLELADHSTVWIEADVHEKDLPLLREGQQVTATVASYPDRVFHGSVALVYPHMEPSTRTNRVRFVVENPRHKLHPGMYATVQLRTPIAETEPFRGQIAKQQAPPENADAQTLMTWQRDCPVTGSKLGSMGPPRPVSVDGKTVYLCCDGCADDIEQSPEKYLAKLAPPPSDKVLTIPQSAVVDTGSHTIVYVQRTPGVFEGVEVTLGPEVASRYPVLAGLAPGDQVAAAGSFLIDAQTRLNPSAETAYYGATGSQDSSSGSSVQRSEDEPGDGANQTKSAADVELTLDQLAEIAKLSPEDRKAARQQKLCPVTEMPLGSMGKPIKAAAGGETVFLCCQGCVKKLQAEPETYLNRLRAWRGETTKPDI